MWSIGVQARCRTGRLAGRARRGSKKVTAHAQSAVNVDHLARRTGVGKGKVSGRTGAVGDLEGGARRRGREMARRMD